MGIAVVKCCYGINIVTHYFKKNEYQNGENCNPLGETVILWHRN